ncbi:hypothetical protein TWF694_002182 [Orbilia ellipsospora]|uniref:Uncharacterized protein n=1 Tax=Orbilia ellipsospora TaxID=2528407 RepID=A0AAV9X4S5_9PEZI
MFGHNQNYAPIPEEEQNIHAENITSRSLNWWKKRKGLTTYSLSLGFSVALNVFLIGLLYILHRQTESRRTSSFPHLLYSPAQDAVHYELKTFESSFNYTSPYTGYPDSEINGRWKQLYRVGNSRISKSEAAQLPNKTIAATAGSDDYLVVISVFHDLHCLDRIRQSLWYFYDDQWNATYNPFTVERPETYKPRGLNGIIHLDHCINIIRQSIQCFSDVTPYVFQWSPTAQAVHAYANVIHTCRNFEAVRPLNNR